MEFLRRHVLAAVVVLVAVLATGGVIGYAVLTADAAPPARPAPSSTAPATTPTQPAPSPTTPVVETLSAEQLAAYCAAVEQNRPALGWNPEWSAEQAEAKVAAARAIAAAVPGYRSTLWLDYAGAYAAMSGWEMGDRDTQTRADRAAVDRGEDANAELLELLPEDCGVQMP